MVLSLHISTISVGRKKDIPRSVRFGFMGHLGFLLLLTVGYFKLK